MQTLFWLWKNETLHFDQLKKHLGGVIHKMLSAKLKELENDNLIILHEHIPNELMEEEQLKK